MEEDFIRIGKVVRDIICDFPEIKLIYLFGSRVQENVGPMSDYDFAVLTDPKQSREDQRAKISHAFSNGLDYVAGRSLLYNFPITH